MSFLTDFALSFLAEYTILFLLVGIALILFGATFISIRVYSLFVGKKVNGKVIGAVRDVEVKIKDGEIVEKRLTSGVLFPIFEYTLTDGIIRQDKGSSGGTHVYNYKTGQIIKLIVWPREGYNDVSDSQGYAEYVIGAVSISFGAYIVYLYISTFSSLNFGAFIWLGAIVSLAIKFKDKLNKLIKKYRSNKENLEKAKALKRGFDPSHVRPIEEYVEERQKNREK